MSIDTAQAVQDGGGYSILKRRLEPQAAFIEQQLSALNDQRAATFGGSKTAIEGNINLLTENNCVPVDMAKVGGVLLMGFDARVGMKKRLQIDDLLATYRITSEQDGLQANQVALQETFLADPRFIKEMTHLLEYNADCSLRQISFQEKSLKIVFMANEKSQSMHVFTFSEVGNDIVYQGTSMKSGHHKRVSDGWIKTTDKDHVGGVSPHVSINDKLFVETIGGDLTIKLENNTETGEGIYSEPVSNKYQNINDAEFAYIDLGDLVLLRVLPLQEPKHRYFIFSNISKKVVRADHLESGYELLPEGHGIVFSGGYALSSGELKVFSNAEQGYFFGSKLVSPNGEDVLYSYFNEVVGGYALYGYNLIDKSMSAPIMAHGVTFRNDGRMLIFKDDQNAAAERLHRIQVWQTPFMNSQQFAASISNEGDAELKKVGNAALVRGISDIRTLLKYARSEEVSDALYEAMIKQTERVVEHHHWLGGTRFEPIRKKLDEVKETAALVLAEFQKVKVMADEAKKASVAIKKAHDELIHQSKVIRGDNAARYTELMTALKAHIGRLVTSKEVRYIDISALEKMELEANKAKEKVVGLMVDLLQEDKAFSAFYDRIDELTRSVEQSGKAIEAEALEVKVKDLTEQLSTLNSEVGEIQVDDSTAITSIITRLSAIFGRLNTLRSQVAKKKEQLLRAEAENEFAAQFKQVGQMIEVAKNNATTPEKCDEELAKLNMAFENLENRFSQFDDYIQEISNKRNDVYSLFETQKAQLVGVIQRRIDGLVKAANISLANIQKRVSRFSDVNELNGYFNTDLMVGKVRQYIERIRELGDVVIADSLAFEIKGLHDVAVRDIRDNAELFDDGGRVAKLGKHRFSVNKKAIELNVGVRDEQPMFFVGSTDFAQPVLDQELNELAHYFKYDTPAENEQVCRAEFLAYQVIKAAQRNEQGLSTAALENALKEQHLGNQASLIEMLSDYITSRYKEGYVKGVHNQDAAKLITAIYPAMKGDDQGVVSSVAARVGWLKSSYCRNSAMMKDLCDEASVCLELDSDMETTEFTEMMVARYADTINPGSLHYALSCMMRYQPHTYVVSKEAFELATAVLKRLGCRQLGEMERSIFRITAQSVQAGMPESVLDEAAEIFVHLKNEQDLGRDNGIVFVPMDMQSRFKVDGMLSEHGRIVDGVIDGDVSDFITHCEYIINVHAIEFERFLAVRQRVTDMQREVLQLSDFTAKPLSSFVRNQLIRDSYLPLIGANLAKQMGTVDNQRTDQNGMLLLLSPPGYGKTTLVEYLSKVLGMVFVKINCPSIGHNITSIIPDDETDAAARKELNKINMALEMGNNALLYLDDIQHTNPEFLQKFISLCDGTRRIEGQWGGKTKTYDMRGKRFAIVMAGNPYTESGEAFKIPDMLSNRADIYNLGDIMSGQQAAFELSYIENAMTSNANLAPLISRPRGDILKLVRMARGEEIPVSDLEHNYAPVEADEIGKLFKHMLAVQQVVLKVNQEYIRSAAMATQYRSEPPFLMQGSYRNMNKMVEKLDAVMTIEEVEDVIFDHYRSESQTLTTGAEENMLRFKELIGKLSTEEAERWKVIKATYGSRAEMVSSDMNPDLRVAIALEQILKKMA